LGGNLQQSNSFDASATHETCSSGDLESSAAYSCDLRVGKGSIFDVSLHEPATDETIQDAHNFSSSDSPSCEPSEHETNQFCHPESQSSLDGSNISFSDLQIERPVVIEIFCGSARVTARLREVGLSDAFGVDHDISKATASAKQLDFTKQSDQRIFLQWLRSPLVVRIFLAPPCGTCSMARNIKLRNSCGKVVPGPIPLHSAQFPEGLMGLTGKNFQRVSAANKLYDFVAHIIKEAVELKLVVVVENPRSSLFWMTRFWKSVSGFFGYTAHQACAYGGERPKWTVLAWNHPAFKHICLSCPGESDLHLHKPWGLVHTDVGTHFSTSEETAYPKGLARAIARVFAENLISHGWKPPQEYFQHTEEASLQVMRTVSNIQPRAAKMPPVAREHKQIVVVRGSLVDLSRAPVGPMQRLKSVYTLPETCNFNFSVLPEGAQLLRAAPSLCWAGSGGAPGSQLTPWTPRVFARQAWQLVAGVALAALCVAGQLVTSTFTLRGRRGTLRRGTR
jgi:hypothetical protein